MIVPVSHLAIQAIMALIGVDLTGRPDGLHLALSGTDLAGAATLLAPPQPVKDTQRCRDGQGGPEWAEILAKKLAVENIDEQQGQGIGKKNTSPVKVHHNRRFKGLNLGSPGCIADGLQGQTQQDDKDDIFQRRQPLMDDVRNSHLGNPETPGNLGNQLLQGTKGTQPAAIHTAPPQ